MLYSRTGAKAEFLSLILRSLSLYVDGYTTGSVMREYGNSGPTVTFQLEHCNLANTHFLGMHRTFRSADIRPFFISSCKLPDNKLDFLLTYY